MTKLLEEALEAVRRMSPATQDGVAKLLLDISANEEGEPDEVPSEHLAAVLEGEAQADRGEFATDESVAAAWRRFDQ